MEKSSILKYVLISCIIIVIYLDMDFFNVFNFITKELNLDAFAILVNAIVVVFVFLITYSLVNKKTFELDQEKNNNKLNLLNILLKETYKDCKENLDMLNNDELLKLYIIPKVDFNKAGFYLLFNFICI
jgi:hypothetical protein